MNDHVKAWQCIGCGAIEAPQTCIGVCTHRKVEFVYADEHERTRAELARMKAHVTALETLLRRIASTRPHAGRHEAALASFQQQARAVLDRN